MRRKSEKIYLDCGTAATPVIPTPGKFWIDIVLFLICLIAGLAIGGTGLLIIPLGLVYSVWRHAKRLAVCSMCGSKRPVPVGSPGGQGLAHAS